MQKYFIFYTSPNEIMPVKQADLLFSASLVKCVHVTYIFMGFYINEAIIHRNPIAKMFYINLLAWRTLAEKVLL